MGLGNLITLLHQVTSTAELTSALRAIFLRVDANPCLLARLLLFSWTGRLLKKGHPWSRSANLAVFSLVRLVKMLPTSS